MKRGQWFWIPSHVSGARPCTAAWVRANLLQSGYTTREARVAMQVCRKVETLACTVKGGSYQFSSKGRS